MRFSSSLNFGLSPMMEGGLLRLGEAPEDELEACMVV